jgi:hypothetical protein
MSVPSALVGVAVWIVNWFHVWVPHWWVWGLAISVGLIAALVFAWVEQFNAVREVSGRPQLTSWFSETNVLALRNSSDVPAMNISAHDITIPIPEHFLRANSEMVEASGFDHKLRTEWVVRFDTVQTLGHEDFSSLIYRIDGMGSAQQSLTDVMGQIIDWSFQSGLPLTLVFSNLGEPIRTWHSHYVVTYNAAPRLTSRHVGGGQVNRHGLCSYCQKLVPLRPTLLSRVPDWLRRRSLESTRHEN